MNITVGTLVVLQAVERGVGMHLEGRGMSRDSEIIRYVAAGFCSETSLPFVVNRPVPYGMIIFMYVISCISSMYMKEMTASFSSDFILSSGHLPRSVLRASRKESMSPSSPWFAGWPSRCHKLSSSSTALRLSSRVSASRYSTCQSKAPE